MEDFERAVADLHPATVDVLGFFEYSHLPEEGQRISHQFHDLAWSIATDATTDGPQLTLCLQDLLRAKDAAVRAALPKRGW